jgi:general secretion pathway protein D
MSARTETGLPLAGRGMQPAATAETKDSCMPKTKVRSAPHWRWVLLLGLALAGCAAQQVHREGMELLQQGKYEQGVAKLEEANRLESGNAEYRLDLLRARERAASRLILTGNAARISEQFDAAEAAYREALRVDPDNTRATVGLDAVLMDRRHGAIVTEAQALFKKGDSDNATAKLKAVFLENANNGGALALQRQINEQSAKQFAAAPTLKASLKKPVTLQFRDANLKMIFESLSKTSGINILLDKDVRAELKTSIFVKDTSVEDAIDLILLQNQLERKVLSDNTIFVYANLPLKHKEYQDLMVRSFHLVYADAKQMQTLLKTILKTKDLYINEKNNSVIMRDTPEAIRLAEKLIDDQDIADPEVIVEVEVMEVTRTRLSVLGIQYPDQVTLTPLITDPVTGAAGATATLGNLGQRTRNNLLVSPVPSLTLNAHLDDSDVQVLASPRIRARNHEKAKIHIGDRVPVMTNSVTPVSTGTPVVTGSVQYLEVGLKLDVEPDIHSDGEVGIKVAMEVSSIVNQVTNAVSGSVAYQIGTRTASTVLRLRDGETQVLAGLIDDEDRKSANKIPALGDLPVLGRLFSSHTRNGKQSEIVLAITPRLVGKTRLPNSQSMEFWTGTENNLRSVPLSLRQTGSVSMSSGLGTPAPVRTTPPVPSRPGGTPAQPGAAAAQQMSFTWQGPAQAKVGDKFTLMLSTQSAEAVRNLGVVVSFDPAVLKAVDAVEGSFLKAGKSGSNFTRDIDQGGGQITVDAADNGDQGFKGSGGVTAITFEVLAAAPQSQIAVVTAAPSSVSGEALAFAPPAPHSMTLNP